MDSETQSLAGVYARPRQFLMVGESQPFMEVLKTVAFDYSCQFTFAYTFAEAVAAIFHLERFDAVWVDLDLNCGHNAVEVLHAVKEKSKIKPVVILFDELDCIRLEHIQNMKKIGVAYYLVKPESPNGEYFEELFGFMRVPKTAIAQAGDTEFVKVARALETETTKVKI